MGSADTSSTSTLSLRGPPTRHVGTVTRAGRTYLSPSDVSVPYPLPVDLAETHRQILFAQLTSLVYGGPVLSADLLLAPGPLRVLELGCDTGWWSAACHAHLRARGRPDAEFVGMDVRPPRPGPGAGGPAGAAGAGADLRWEYVQHDLNRVPWPFPDGAFDLVMARNIALALDGRRYSEAVQEYVRVLRPGGTLELWEHDVTLRSLRPEVHRRRPRRRPRRPPPPQEQKQQQQHDGPPSGPAAAGATESEEAEEEDPEEDPLAALGLYPAADSASFRPAACAHAARYNAWLTAGLADLELPTMPCSYIDAMFRGHLVGGSEDLETERMAVRRVAVPLSTRPMGWERGREDDGEGDDDDDDGEDEPEAVDDGEDGGEDGEDGGALGPDQEVIRRTALESFVGMVEAFGPLLQDKSGMGQADWDAWLARAKRDWLGGRGFSSGECVELGAWSVRKKKAAG